MTAPGSVVTVQDDRCLYDRRWSDDGDGLVLAVLRAGARLLVLAAVEPDDRRRRVWALVLPRSGTHGWTMLPARAGVLVRPGRCTLGA